MVNIMKIVINDIMEMNCEINICYLNIMFISVMTEEYLFESSK